jgi:uncharacterized peroxidase-related enzyme
MSRINTPAVETATGAAAEIFAQVKKSAGRVPNAYAAIGALAPSALKAILGAEAALAGGTLDKKDVEVVKIIVSKSGGCDYCVAAHSAVGKLVGLAPDTLSKIRAGEPTGDAKRDALASLVHALADTSGTITDDQFAAIKAAGYTDTQLAEISLAVAAITFTNVFNRINDTDIDFPAVD